MKLPVQNTPRSSVKRRSVALTLVSIFALTASDIALAQFKWKDSNGRWVYSDQPPPSGVAVQPVAATSTKTANAQAVSAEGKLNGDDRALAAKRKELEASQAAKAKQDLVKKNQVACDETRANLKTMQGEVRVTMTDVNGERRFLSEQEKQTRSQAAQKDLAANCNG
jgi:hypothetical protein